VKQVPEHVVGDRASLVDPVFLVEGPVDAEVDPALAVLLLGVRERSEGPRDHRPHHPSAPFVIPLNSSEVKLKRDLVGAVEPPQDLEHRSTEAGVTGRIGRERRREVRTPRGSTPARPSA
jgi:hypothetical protein